MPSIEVEINEFTKPLLEEAFNKRLSQVRADIERLKENIEQLKKEENNLTLLSAKLDFSDFVIPKVNIAKENGKTLLDHISKPTNGFPFNPKWGWLTKAKYIVENLIEGEINSNTVSDKLVELQPELDRVTVYKNVSGDLGKLATGLNAILIRQKAARGFTYKLIKKPS